MKQKPIPTGNRLLDSLSAASSHRLLQAGRWVDLKFDVDFDWTRNLKEFAYFPSSCVLELVGSLPDGSSAGLLMIGSEAFCGSCIFPSDFAMDLRVVVILPGRALRIPQASLMSEFEQEECTRWALLKSLHKGFEQASETSAFRARLTLLQLLSRWLVMVEERAGIGRIKITQERLAQTLGVRREGISEAFGRLEAQGLVDCRRGKIRISNLQGLRRVYTPEHSALGVPDQATAV